MFHVVMAIRHNLLFLLDLQSIKGIATDLLVKGNVPWVHNDLTHRRGGLPAILIVVLYLVDTKVEE